MEFHNQTSIEAVECAGPDKGFRVVARCAGRDRTWEVDRVVGNVGYTPDTMIYRGLQVHDCCATFGPLNRGADHLHPPAPGTSPLCNPEPGFHILGAKSHGRDSNFLMREGFEQIREVFTLIMGKADLDLYKKR